MRRPLTRITLRVTGRYDSIALLLLQYLKPRPANEQYDAFEELAKRGGIFWHSTWKVLRKDDDCKDMVARLKWAAPIVIGDPKNQRQRLSKVITSNKNGFEHEAALVKLALGLIDFSAKRHDVLSLSPNDIDVEADHHGNWMELWHPEVTKITCALSVLAAGLLAASGLSPFSKFSPEAKISRKLIRHSATSGHDQMIVITCPGYHY